MLIADNIARVRERIDVAARRAGRSPEKITLMGVTKTVPADRIREAHTGGLRVFGENRVQEFAGKCSALSDLTDAEWHMIGHLQSNKANKAAELFSYVDSVDSLRLAQKLNSAAAGLKKKISVLIEINIGDESAKSGMAPEPTLLEEVLGSAAELSAIAFRGLMAVPPYYEDPEQSRPYFRRMRRLYEEMARRKFPGTCMEILSMGMSHDFEIAIEEGATSVRVGTAIFGARPPVRSSK
jgi:pyridoxal phosphate enzyme (YggS family)